MNDLTLLNMCIVVEGCALGNHGSFGVTWKKCVHVYIVHVEAYIR